MSIDGFESADPKVRLRAVLAAGRLDTLDEHQDDVHALLRRLDDEHPGVRQATLDVLTQLCASRGLVVEESVLHRAIELTDDETVGVRSEAASALAVFCDGLDHPPRISALQSKLTDASPRVRASAAAALGDLRQTQLANDVANLLQDEDADVRFEAAFALASLKDDRGRTLLEEKLADKKLRLDACEALKRLGDPRARPALKRLLEKWFLPWVDKLAAQATLHVLGEPKAYEYVLERSSSRNLRERSYALALMGSHGIQEGQTILQRVAEDQRDVLRGTAIRSLGELGGPQSQRFLLKLQDKVRGRDYEEDVQDALQMLKKPLL